MPFFFYLRETRGGDGFVVELSEQLRYLGTQLRPHGPRYLVQADAVEGRGGEGQGGWPLR